MITKEYRASVIDYFNTLLRFFFSFSKYSKVKTFDIHSCTISHAIQ